MADPHPSSSPQTNPQPPPPSQTFPQPPPTPAKKSYSSIVQHPTAAHFPHDPYRAAKKSFHNEDLPQMGTATTHKGDPGHDYNTCLSKSKPDTTRSEVIPETLETQASELDEQIHMVDNDTAKKKGKRVMFTEDNQENSTKQKDPRTEIPSKEMLRPNEKDVSLATNGYQQASHVSKEISDEDNFNYDDPIIAELLDKDWDKELNKQGKSPSDKAAQFDLTSSKNGTSGESNRDPQPVQPSNSNKQLTFTPAWSLEEGESDIMETHMEGSRTFYKGDTSTFRTTDSQEIEAVGEEEEDSTLYSTDFRVSKIWRKRIHLLMSILT
ncbi:hypothetical protein Salat_0146700 [Sesamum alatum]|uniref:Uncharacterized protein n=1 Tax=Sesamum alatum TaxID=300844 RepID=A0AAE2CXC3_9LAMI|nr:hypothetical protein Salat_0146700 [Sesamum alatum]